MENTITAKNPLKDIIFWAISGLSVVILILYTSLGWQTVCENINRYLNAIILSVLVVAISLGVQKLANLIISHIKAISQRGKTITALLNSIIKYLIAIVALVMVLTFILGDDYIDKLFAGIGVLALIIGLGCQALISDIVAGVFMVFEGQFQVGDVIVVDGWRGTVKEIGLRTTVIEDVGGNIQIINNSNISKVVNNSKALSVAISDIGIEYGESIEKVEKLLDENLASFKDKIPAIVEGPYYKGVQELGDSAVVLRFIAKTTEDDKYQVQRDVNRELKILFDNNNVGIPFPQVTVSYLKDEQQAKVSSETKKRAKVFVDEQKESSKGIDEIN